MVLYDYNAAASPTLVDFLVTHPTARSSMTLNYAGVGFVAASKERAKVRKYLRLALQQGFEFT
eukprot:SAG22_NODE_12734_length_431_cov_0.921687_1_plen_62_part_10